METKKCCRCKVKYPKTSEFFYTKNVKHKLIDGTFVYYKSFRSVCRKCHGITGNERRIRKRCIDMCCDINDYRENWIKQMVKAKDPHPEVNDLPPWKTRSSVLKKIRNGYEYKTWEQYREDCGINISIAKRKYDYGQVDKVNRKMRQKMYSDVVTDARVALIMGMSVKDVPKEVIETKRILIILKREAGLTHSTKKH